MRYDEVEDTGGTEGVKADYKKEVTIIRKESGVADRGRRYAGTEREVLGE